jgi:hypothetical protein
MLKFPDLIPPADSDAADLPRGGKTDSLRCYGATGVGGIDGASENAGMGRASRV